MPRASGGVDDGLGARPQAELVGQVAQPLDLGLDVEGPIVDGRQHQLPRRVQARPGQRLVLVLDDHAVNARLRGFAGAAEADLACRPAICNSRVTCSRMWPG